MYEKGTKQTQLADHQFIHSITIPLLYVLYFGVMNSFEFEFETQNRSMETTLKVKPVEEWDSS